jgi:citrate synthase
MVNVFWRAKPLAAQQAKLLTLVLAAHAESAHRENISTAVLKNAAVGSGSYIQSVSAALCSLGGVHAPLIQTHYYLAHFSEEQIPELAQHIELGGKVPGWGSSFEKDGPDPIWKPVADHIAEHFPEISERLQRITDELHARGKMVWPNPSAWTAATAIIIDLPPQICAWIFIQGRLANWSSLFYNTLVEHNAPHRKDISERLPSELQG